MRIFVLTFVVLGGLPLGLPAQQTQAGPAANDTTEAVKRDTLPARVNIFGFAMADMGYDFKQTNPQWYDTNRPSKLPAFADQFGKDGSLFAGVRQTRFGVKGWVPTNLGQLFTWFEIDMFGVGVDAGQTTIRPRHFWGQLGHFGAGQTNSPFMDGDVFPNSVEYWGPNGMLFFRNIQVAWMPVQGEYSKVTLALERPGASGDGGDYANRIEVQNVKARFPAPDVSGEWRMGGPWGYVELAGMLRYMKLDDLLADAFDLNKTIWAGGGSLSSNLKFGKDVLRLQGVYGAGIENYYNDAPFDVGVQNNPGNVTSPISGKALPIWSVVAFLDHTWNDRFTSSIGYSYESIDNSTGQAADAFHVGQYGLANILYSPVKNALAGVEFLYGRRENYLDGFKVNDYRVQFSFKYGFSFDIGGKSS